MRNVLTPAGFVVLFPLLAGLVLAVVRERSIAAWFNAAATVVTFGLACALPWQTGAGPLLLVDAPGALVAMLVSFVGVASAWSMVIEPPPGELRLRHALFQLLLALTLLELLCNDLGVTLICAVAALVVTVVALGTALTAGSITAALRYLMLGSVGLALAMFGAVALHLAVRPAPLAWSSLAQAVGAFDPGLLNLGFMLLVFGYGTLVGVAPLHGWLPEVTAVGAAPIATMFIGATQLAPMLIILRVRHVMALHAGSFAPGPLLLALGIASLLVGAFGVWRERETRRAFAFAGIGQCGVVLTAFGGGSTAATFAGVMALTLYALTRPALFFAAHRDRLTAMVAIVAMAGLPPFGIFAGWYLAVVATLAEHAWLALPLVVGQALLAIALLTRMSGLPQPARNSAPSPMVLAAVCLCLVPGIVIGYALPAPVANWFALVAESLQ